MHIPDGFIDGATSATAAVAAAGGLGASLRRAGASLKERLVPFAGVTAAFVFALQMLNFPVGPFTSGHVLGGALAAILLGPWLGVVAVSVVVIVQALLFADGGVTALGLNVLNMAVVTAGVAWPVFRAGVRLLPARSPFVLAAAMAAAWASVVASSAAFSVEYALGGNGGIDPATVFAAMVGVHSLIGVGEGLITAVALAAVLAVRPDLVAGVEGVAVSTGPGAAPSTRAIGVLVAVGLAVAAALAVFVAPFADDDPDGLERVAEDTGFAATAAEHPITTPLADYGVEGVESPAVATALAGVVGIGITFAAGMILVGLARRRRSAPAP